MVTLFFIVLHICNITVCVDVFFPYFVDGASALLRHSCNSVYVSAVFKVRAWFSFPQ